MTAVINSENAEHYHWGQGCDGWFLVRSPELTVIRERVPPGGSEVRHFHQQAWQFFMVLEGEALLEVNGVSFPLRAQEGLEVTPRTPHQLRNVAQHDVVFLVISRPDSHGDRVVVEEGAG